MIAEIRKGTQGSICVSVLTCGLDLTVFCTVLRWSSEKNDANHTMNKNDHPHQIVLCDILNLKRERALWSTFVILMFLLSKS